jgi:O-antigen/teichoic acid export membrane protein
MFDLVQIVSKKIRFVILNLAAIIYLIATHSLRWDAVSIFSYGLALGLMNCIAWISARKYKEWK